MFHVFGPIKTREQEQKPRFWCVGGRWAILICGVAKQETHAMRCSKKEHERPWQKFQRSYLEGKGVYIR